MRYAIQFAAFLLAAASAAYAQTPKMAYDRSAMTGAQQSARSALAEFSGLVTELNFKSLGFDTAGQVKEAALGDPIAEYMVRLDELKAFTSGTDPVSLLRPTGRVTYPVRVGGTTRSGMTVARRGDAWATEGFGGATYVKLLDEIRSQSARASGRNNAEFFEVRVPSLNTTFIGFSDGSGLRLVPILSNPRYGLVRGEPKSARDVFQALATAAREHNDLPGAR